MSTVDHSRRDFLKQSSLASAGLMIGFSTNPTGPLFNLEKETATHALTPFIFIDTSGQVTLVNTNPDMGQGTLQAIPALLAEELEVDPQKVLIMQSDGDPKYGVQISGGGSRLPPRLVAPAEGGSRRQRNAHQSGRRPLESTSR